MPTNYHNVGEEAPNQLCIATLGCTENGYVFPVRCKRWNCSVCAPLNALHEAIRTANGVRAIYAAGLIPKFATITQPASVKTPEFAYHILADQWDKFRNRWQYWARKQNAPNFYAAFVEGQARRDGMPHFHVIATLLPKKSLLGAWVVESGLGYETSLSTVKPNSGAAWYVSKYSTKSSDAALMPKGFRRVRYSQDWPQMRFRVDDREDAACVKLPGETIAHWTWRCAELFGTSPNDVARQAEDLLSSALPSRARETAERQALDVVGA